MLVLLSTSWFEVVVKTTVYPGWITLLVSLAVFFFILFSAEKIRQLLFFLNTNLVSQGVRFDFSSSRRIFQPWELI